MSNDFKITKDKEGKINVVIISGHNELTWDRGKEKGRVLPDGKIFEEFDFNYGVVSRIVNILNKYNIFRVYQIETNNGTVDKTLIERIRFVNTLPKNHTVVIDIHGNANKEEFINGMWGFYGSTIKNTGRFSGEYFLKVFQTNVKDSPIPYTRTYQCKKNTWTSFGIVLKTNPVAILLELGFFTNNHDVKIMQTNEFKDYISDKIVISIAQFLNVSLPEKKKDTELIFKVNNSNDILEKIKKVLNKNDCDKIDLEIKLKINK